MSEEVQQPQWFSATSGRVSGMLGLLSAAAVVVTAVMSGSLGWVLAGLLAGALIWLVLLRPRVGLRGRTLLLRGMTSTIEIPLSLVSAVKVRQVFVVWVGDRRYVNASLGLSLRDIRPRRISRPDGMPQLAGHLPERTDSEGTRVANPYVGQILELIRSHQADAARWGDEGGGVRRHWAIAELSATTVLAIALVLVGIF